MVSNPPQGSRRAQKIMMTLVWTQTQIPSVHGMQKLNELVAMAAGGSG